MDKKVLKRSIFPYVFLFIAITLVFSFMNFLDTKVNEIIKYFINLM